MIRKEFWKNVLPSMISFAFTGLYAIVDGFFVGRNVGDAGLAAINILFPLIALVQAMGTGLGMAGAVQIAINRGKKDEESEKRNLGNVLVLLVIAGIIATVLLTLIHTPALKAFGASGEILHYAKAYMKIAAAGAVLQIFSTGLVPIIRNYDGAVMAMFAMVAGFVTNIILDWAFVSVLGYGVAGASAATLIGQFVTTVPCIIYLIIKVHFYKFAIFRLSRRTVGYLLKIAVSPFGLTLSPNLVIMIINKGAVVYGGSAAVSCYAVVSYVICVAQLLLQGIGDGAQPVVGRYYGAGKSGAVSQIRRMAYVFAEVTACVSIVLMYLTRNNLADLFGVSAKVGTMYAGVIVYFISSLLFAAFLRITIAYFYAVEKNASAYVLIYGEPLLLAVLVAFVFPRYLGIAGVWAAFPVTQVCLAVIAFILTKRFDENEKMNNKFDEDKITDGLLRQNLKAETE